MKNDNASNTTLQIIVFILACLIFCFADSVFAQDKWYKPTKNDIWIAGAQFIAGTADGVREQVLYHPDALLREHPSFDPYWWDSRLSQHNKEHTWVAFSDANHTFKTINQSADLISIGIPLFEGKKYRKKDLWLVALRKITIGYIARKLAFHLTYNSYFKNH